MSGVIVDVTCCACGFKWQRNMKVRRGVVNLSAVPCGKCGSDDEFEMSCPGGAYRIGNDGTMIPGYGVIDVRKGKS